MYRPGGHFGYIKIISSNGYSKLKFSRMNPLVSEKICLDYYIHI